MQSHNGSPPVHDCTRFDPPMVYEVAVSVIIDRRHIRYGASPLHKLEVTPIWAFDDHLGVNVTGRESWHRGRYLPTRGRPPVSHPS